MKLLFGLVTALVFASAVPAQTATLRGQVTDESGAVIPAAKVTVSGPAGVVRTATATNDGRYSFTGMTPGNYTVQATAPELTLPQPAEISLVSGVRTLNLQLKIASTSQQVTVRDNPGPFAQRRRAEQRQRTGSALR